MDMVHTLGPRPEQCPESQDAEVQERGLVAATVAPEVSVQAETETDHSGEGEKVQLPSELADEKGYSADGEEVPVQSETQDESDHSEDSEQNYEESQEEEHFENDEEEDEFEEDEEEHLSEGEESDVEGEEEDDSEVDAEVEVSGDHEHVDPMEEHTAERPLATSPELIVRRHSAPAAQGVEADDSEYDEDSEEEDSEEEESDDDKEVEPPEEHATVRPISPTSTSPKTLKEKPIVRTDEDVEAAANLTLPEIEGAQGGPPTTLVRALVHKDNRAVATTFFIFAAALAIIPVIGLLLSERLLRNRFEDASQRWTYSGFVAVILVNLVIAAYVAMCFLEGFSPPDNSKEAMTEDKKNS